MRSSRVLASVAVILAWGCVREAHDDRITWEAERRLPGAMAPGATVLLTEGGVPAVRAAWIPTRAPDDSAACRGSVVAAPAAADAAYAAWWSAADSGAVTLVFARSPNGISWEAPRTIAPGGAAPQGCRRPPPSMAIDPATGAIHVAFGAGATGAGTVAWFASRDGGSTFTQVAAVATGGFPPFVSIAAAGDTVALAFESGTFSDPAVRLAISLQKGQIPGVVGTVSSGGAKAFAPVVALRNGLVAVGWNEARTAEHPASAVARVGRINR